MPDINIAYSWAVQTCNAPNVGYSQPYRNQRTINGITYYDCSSFIWYSLIAGGFDCVSAHNGSTWPMTTYDEASVLTALGFTQVPLIGMWLPGDIGLSSGHTEMVYKGGDASGVCMGAHTGNTTLANQVSIGSSSGNADYVSTASRWTSLWRYGDGGAVGYGVSIYVVAAMCGNFWQESGINPGIWEGLSVAGWDSLLHGYGLGQWTNTNGDTHGRLYRLHEFLVSNGYQEDSGNGELAFLIDENYWIPHDAYGTAYSSLTDFLASDSTDIAALTHAYNDGWEGIHDSSWDLRVEYARRCFDYIQAHANDSSITNWITGNRYLSEEERLNNAVMVYRWLSAGGGGGGTPGNLKKKMPAWMKIRYY